MGDEKFDAHVEIIENMIREYMFQVTFGKEVDEFFAPMDLTFLVASASVPVDFDESLEISFRCDTSCAIMDKIRAWRESGKTTTLSVSILDRQGNKQYTFSYANVRPIKIKPLQFNYKGDSTVNVSVLFEYNHR